MRPKLRLPCLLSLSLTGLAACGGGKDVDPELIAGGGIHDAGIDGEVNVFVIDAGTDDPIAGAEVRVGSITGTTGADGLFVAAGDLSGPQTVTVIADDYTSTSWVGVNGANVTIPVALRDPLLPDDAPQATLSGTITDFTSLTPAQGSAKVALVGYSRNHDDDDPANQIDTPGDPAPNACFNFGIGQPPPCAWVLDTRTGPQAIFAFIGNYDVDTMAITIDGFAYATGIEVEDGADQDGIVLAMAAAGDLTTADLSLPSAPAGTETVQALIRMDLGVDGQLLLPQSTELAVPVPDTSLFPGSSYQLIGVAQADSDATQSVVITRGVTDVSDAAVEAFQDLPSGLSATATAFSFDAVASATLHTFAVVNPADDRVAWAVAIFDGSSEVALPEGVTLPEGSLELRVTAIELPETDLDNFELEEVTDTVTRLSQDYVTFTN